MHDLSYIQFLLTVDFVKKPFSVLERNLFLALGTYTEVNVMIIETCIVSFIKFLDCDQSHGMHFKQRVVET